jgi:hypothetical protein
MQQTIISAKKQEEEVVVTWFENLDLDSGASKQ